MDVDQTHDLFVRAGDGVSNVSIENTMSDSFNYLGYDVTVEGAEIYKIYYTTSKREAVLRYVSLKIWDFGT